jgi:hypothetical protein
MHREINGGEVDELVAQQLSRGWFVGGEGFRNWLAQQLLGRTDNLRGEQRTAHDEVEAERLLQRALAELKVSESELLSMKNNRPEKQAVAWLLKNDDRYGSLDCGSVTDGFPSEYIPRFVCCK